MKETQLRFLSEGFLTKEDFVPTPEKQELKISLSNCCCDYTNHCPVHGSRSTPAHARDDYINQP